MIGIQDYAHAAQLQREYENQYDYDLPRCAVCNDEFESQDLVNGICERCARDLYDIARGREFINDHQDEWLVFLDGEDTDTMSMGKFMSLVKEFCLDEMADEWRSWVNV